MIPDTVVALPLLSNCIDRALVPVNDSIGSTVLIFSNACESVKNEIISCPKERFRWPALTKGPRRVCLVFHAATMFTLGFVCVEM